MYDMEKLKKLRVQKNYSIKEMADRLNISTAYYCLIENKKRNLYYDMAVRIADIFGLRPDDLFYKKD